MDTTPARVRTLQGSLLALTLVAGVVTAAQMAWVCDDAFISFRYAKNLADGVGLVYNAGEIVEGYSNFLWTVMVAGAMRLGGDPVAFSENAGMVFFVGVLAIMAVLSRRVFGRRGSLPVASLACLLYVLMRDARVWATGGLETAMFTFWVLASYALFLRRRRPVCAALSGLAMALAMLTRIDAAAFAGILGAYALWRRLRHNETAPLWGFAVPMAAVFAPYFAWRYARYGFLMPNPYYAKSAYLAYWSQGAVFLGIYLAASSAWLLLPLAAMVGRRMRLHAGEREAVWLAAALAALYTLLVVRVGGDHMASRLLIPVTPFVCLLMERCVRSIRWDPVRWSACAVLAACVFFAPDVPAGRQEVCDITNERNWYPREWLELSEAYGRTLRQYLGGTHAAALTGGCQCAIGYYSDLPVLIEETGLTDKHIAHGPILGPRGMVGHEKYASRGYLVLDRGVQLSLCDSLTDYNTARIGPYRIAMLYYDDALLSKLQARRGVDFVRFPEYMARYVRELPNKLPATVAKDYLAFRLYYFYHHPESPFMPAIEDYLRGHGLLAHAEPQGRRPAARWGPGPQP